MQQPMRFRHTPDIWRDFPQLVPGLLYVTDIDAGADVSARLEPYFERARARLAQGPESELPEVAAWRRAYAQMGMKPTQYRSAAEALLRRFRREDTLPRLHSLVDLCNAVSLAFALPVAVLDLDQVAEFIDVRYADGTEQYLAFSGEVESPEPGEVIFADAANQVHARRWTFRQSRRSTVSEQTRRALIVSEGLHTTAGTDVQALLNALETELTAVGMAVSGRAVLTADAPGWAVGDG
jgi:DNA/RNA-binding domain of Phe-tRNA-synthetase-like protein